MEFILGIGLGIIIGFIVSGMIAITNKNAKKRDERMAEVLKNPLSVAPRTPGPMAMSMGVPARLDCPMAGCHYNQISTPLGRKDVVRHLRVAHRVGTDLLPLDRSDIDEWGLAVKDE